MYTQWTHNGQVVNSWKSERSKYFARLWTTRQNLQFNRGCNFSLLSMWSHSWTFERMQWPNHSFVSHAHGNSHPSHIHKTMCIFAALRSQQFFQNQHQVYYTTIFTRTLNSKRVSDEQQRSVAAIIFKKTPRSVTLSLWIAESTITVHTAEVHNIRATKNLKQNDCWHFKTRSKHKKLQNLHTVCPCHNK